MIMKKVYQYILMAVAIVAMASCSEKEMFEPDAQKTTALRVVVGDFPAFGGNPQTRASINGTPDAGKTHWVENDEIIITVKSEKYGTQYATLTYDGEEWCFDDYLKYLEGENEEDGTLEITALYAPCYEVMDDAISLKEGMIQGMDEYLEVKCHIENRGVLQIPFSQADRNYSRIRIVSPIGEKYLWIGVNDYTPAGYGNEHFARKEFRIDIDENENAYIYGVFSEGGSIEVYDYETGYGTLMLNYEFTEATETRKSYALDARLKIDATWGGKEEVTDEDLTELQNFFMSSVNAGRTTFVVTGETQAMYNDPDWGRYPFVGTALMDLPLQGSYVKTMNLIYRDVTKIVSEEIIYCKSLKTLSLPKVTECGNNAFYQSSYLEKITFGSVVTSVGEEAFKYVGYDVVGGCELVLNKDQVAVEGLAPDFDSMTWAGHTWKSITLK